MPTIQDGFYIEGLQDLIDRFGEQKFKRRLVSKVMGATRRNAGLGQKAVQKAIRAGRAQPKLSQATIAMKGGHSKTLTDTLNIVKAVRGYMVKWDEAHIGVLKGNPPDRHGHKHSLEAIVRVMHVGRTYWVTPKMRQFFVYMARKYERGEIKEKWLPLKWRTRFIVVPARPFLTFAMDEKNAYKANWINAVYDALLDRKAAPRKKSTFQPSAAYLAAQESFAKAVL